MSDTNYTPEQLQAIIDQLKAENAALVAKKGKAPRITMRVGQKGGMCLYGLGRYPVTLYKSQWLALLGEVENIRKFLTDHAGELKEKPEANGAADAE